MRRARRRRRPRRRGGVDGHARGVDDRHLGGMGRGQPDPDLATLQSAGSGGRPGGSGPGSRPLPLRVPPRRRVGGLPAGDLLPGDGVESFVEVTVTGGTGQFANATGSFVAHVIVRLMPTLRFDITLAEILPGGTLFY